MAAHDNAHSYTDAVATSDDGNMTDDQYYEFGTPQPRSTMKSLIRAVKVETKRHNSSKTKKAFEPAQAVTRQARNMASNRREKKDRRQRARAQDRFFKEIDTTMEALGIGTTGPAAAPPPASPAGSCLSLAPSTEQPTPPCGRGMRRRAGSGASLRSSECMASGTSTPDRTPRGTPTPVDSRVSLSGMVSEPSYLRSAAQPVPGQGSMERRRTTQLPPQHPGTYQAVHQQQQQHSVTMRTHHGGGVGPTVLGLGYSAAAVGTAGGIAAAAGGAFGQPHQISPTAAAAAAAAQHRRALSQEELPPAMQQVQQLQQAIGALQAGRHSSSTSTLGTETSSSKLMADREMFRSTLDSVLVEPCEPEEDPESMAEDGLNDAEEAASELEKDVEELRREMSPGWHEVKRGLSKLAELLKRAEQTMEEMGRISRIVLEDSDGLLRQALVSERLLKGLVQAVQSVATACGAALLELGDLQQRGSEEEVRTNFKTARRLLLLADKVAKRIKRQLLEPAQRRAALHAVGVPDGDLSDGSFGDDYDELLAGTSPATDTTDGSAAARQRAVVSALSLVLGLEDVARELAGHGVKAAERAVPLLLQPLKVAAAAEEGGFIMHERSNKARRLIALWEEASVMVDRLVLRPPGSPELLALGSLASPAASHVPAPGAPPGVRQPAAGILELLPANTPSRLNLACHLSIMYNNAGHLAGLMLKRCKGRGAGGAGSCAGSSLHGAGSMDEEEVDLHADADSGSEEDDEEADEEACGLGRSAQAPSAWGSGQRAGPTDQEVQAQAWVPGLLQVLLQRAHDAHKLLRLELNILDRAHQGAAEGDEAKAEFVDLVPPGDEEEGWSTLDTMVFTFTELCLHSTRRTAWLCSGNEPLAVWALELCRDAAEACIRFVRDYDCSSLSVGALLEEVEFESEMRAEEQDLARKWWNLIKRRTTRVVNGLLNIRRRINVRQMRTSGNGTAASAAALPPSAAARLQRPTGAAASHSRPGSASSAQRPTMGVGRGRPIGQRMGVGYSHVPAVVAPGTPSPGSLALQVPKLKAPPSLVPAQQPAAAPHATAASHAHAQLGGSGAASNAAAAAAAPGRHVPVRAAAAAADAAAAATIGTEATTVGQDPTAAAASAAEPKPWRSALMASPFKSPAQHQQPAQQQVQQEGPPGSPHRHPQGAPDGQQQQRLTRTHSGQSSTSSVSHASAQHRGAAAGQQPYGSRPPSDLDSAGPGPSSQRQQQHQHQRLSGGGETTTPAADAALGWQTQHPHRAHHQDGRLSVRTASRGGRTGRGHGRVYGRGRQPRDLDSAFADGGHMPTAGGALAPSGYPNGGKGYESSPDVAGGYTSPTPGPAGKQAVSGTSTPGAGSPPGGQRGPPTPLSYAFVTRSGGAAANAPMAAAAAVVAAAAAAAGRSPFAKSPAGAGAASRASGGPASPRTSNRNSLDTPAAQQSTPASGQHHHTASPAVSAADMAAASACLPAAATSTAPPHTTAVSPQWPARAAPSGAALHPAAPMATPAAPTNDAGAPTGSSAAGQPTAAQAQPRRSTPSPFGAAAPASPQGRSVSPFAAAAGRASTTTAPPASPAAAPARPTSPFAAAAAAVAGRSGSVADPAPAPSLTAPARPVSPFAATSSRPGASAAAGQRGPASPFSPAAASRTTAAPLQVPLPAHADSDTLSSEPSVSPGGQVPRAPPSAAAVGSPHSAAFQFIHAAGAAANGRHVDNAHGTHTPRIGSPPGPLSPAAAAAAAQSPAAVLAADARGPSAAGLAISDFTSGNYGQAPGAGAAPQLRNGHHPAAAAPMLLHTADALAPGGPSDGGMLLPNGGPSQQQLLHATAAAALGLTDPELAALLRQIARDPFWAIRWSDLQHSLNNQMGSGSTGMVFAGLYHHADVAIKVIKINRGCEFDLHALRSFKAEVDLNKRLNSHPNIVRFIGVCAEYIQQAARQAGLVADIQGPPLPALSPSSNPMLAIVMECCHLGNLFSMIAQARVVARHIEDGKKVSSMYKHGYDFWTRWERRLEVLAGAAAGLEYMHSCDVIHHDFTSYNLLLDEKANKWATKVCDFNLSRVVMRAPGGAGTGTAGAFAGAPGPSVVVPHSGTFNSPGWQSPEYLAGEDYGKTTDVFSFGVVVWEVITLQEPWANELQHLLARECSRLLEIQRAVTSGRRLQFPDLALIKPPLPELEELVNLAQACWAQDPRQRPRMNEVAEQLRDLLHRVREREEQLRRQMAAQRAAERAAAAGAAAGGASIKPATAVAAGAQELAAVAHAQALAPAGPEAAGQAVPQQ